MEQSSQRRAAQPFILQNASRSDIRRAIYAIIRRLLVDRRARQGLDGAGPRPSQQHRRHVLLLSRVLEDMLYTQAGTMAAYRDASTLEERVAAALATHHRAVRAMHDGRRGAATQSPWEE